MRRHRKEIQEIMREVVSSVNTKLIDQLKWANANINSVRFDWGHPNELIASMVERTQNPGTEAGDLGKYDMWPIIFLFTDIGNDYGSRFTYPDMRLNMVIAMNTRPDMKAEEREAVNFVPILRPIYRELIEQVDRSIYIRTQSARQIEHTATERFFWGKTGLYGNQGNVLLDYVDAIEIQNLKISLYP